jgi:hypothetical protein
MGFIAGNPVIVQKHVQGTPVTLLGSQFLLRDNHVVIVAIGQVVDIQTGTTF